MKNAIGRGRYLGRVGLLSLALVLGLSGARAADATAAAGTPESALQPVFSAVVRIDAVRLRPDQGRLQKIRTGGSGAIISAQGHVITNYHVAQDADYYRCYLTDGTKVEARRVGLDALTDIAVLQLDLTQLPKAALPLAVATFGDSAKLGRGEAVFALGSPATLSQSITRGIVSNPSLVLPESIKMILDGENVGEVVRWILHDASIFPGNSGGPLVNARGEIVGINEMGVANLGGAIPGNLARFVAEELIAHGNVTRGWTGLTVQSRLEADRADGGVLVADVAAGSPAGAAGLQPGDVVLTVDGVAIAGSEEESVASYSRLEMGRMPGEGIVLGYRRAGQPGEARLTLIPRERAQGTDIERVEWGAVVRDITRQLARNERLPDQKGVWLENIRPGGPAGQAEPELRRGDVIVEVDGESVPDAAALKTLTDRLLPDTPNAVRTVLAGVRRDGAVLNSVVELRRMNPRSVTVQSRRAWLGVASQPLTPKLAARLGIKAEGGARLTQVYPGTMAESAGLRVGDVILALDGAPVLARRAEDSDLLARQVRQYRAGTEAKISLWRDGQSLDLPVVLSEQPTPAAEMDYWDDVALEFAVRDIAFEDRVRLQLPVGAKGALVERVVPAGWAALAGLRQDDLILKADDVTVASVPELKEARTRAAASERTTWVLLVERRGQTLFIEINLTPAKK
jgi:serine protease Do